MLYGLKHFFKSHLKLLIVILVIAETISIVYTKLQPRLYRTSSAIKVNSNVDLSISGAGTYLTKRENISTHALNATGYTMLLKLAKKMSLIPDTATENIVSMEKKYTEIINSLQSKIQYSVSPVTNTIIFTVITKKPEESQEIANLLVFTYKDYAFNTKKRFFKKQKHLIRKQYDLYLQEIANLEKMIINLKKNRKGNKINEEIVYTLNEYSEIQNELEGIELNISEISYQKSQLTDKYYRHPLRKGGSEDSYKADSLIIPDNIQLTSDIFITDIGLLKLSDRLTGIQIELNTNLAYYTPLHPKIITLKTAMKKTIVEIVEKLNEKLSKEESRKKDITIKKREIEKKLIAFPRDKMNLARLQRDLKIKEVIFNTLKSKLQEATIRELGLTEDIAIGNLATLPDKAINKNIDKAITMGLYFGIVIGIISGIVKDLFDPSIKTIEHLQSNFKPPVLAAIPTNQIEIKKDLIPFMLKTTPSSKHRSSLVTHFDPKNISAESYKMLRENIEAIYRNDNLKIIMVTSAIHSEGKSCTISNLAVAYAQLGMRVLLMECDFRNPSIEKIFSIGNNPGLTDIILGKHRWNDCLITVSDILVGGFLVDDVLSYPGLENLFIISHGLNELNPSMIFELNQMHNLMEELKSNFDIIFVDTPPFLSTADSMILCRYVDGVILVYRSGKTPKSQVCQCIEKLKYMNVKILGIVLNDITVDNLYIKVKRKRKKPPDSDHKI